MKWEILTKDLEIYTLTISMSPNANIEYQNKILDLEMILHAWVADRYMCSIIILSSK